MLRFGALIPLEVRSQGTWQNNHPSLILSFLPLSTCRAQPSRTDVLSSFSQPEKRPIRNGTVRLGDNFQRKYPFKGRTHERDGSDNWQKCESLGSAKLLFFPSFFQRLSEANTYHFSDLPSNNPYFWRLFSYSLAMGVAYPVEFLCELFVLSRDIISHVSGQISEIRITKKKVRYYAREIEIKVRIIRIFSLYINLIIRNPLVANFFHVEGEQCSKFQNRNIRWILSIDWNISRFYDLESFRHYVYCLLVENNWNSHPCPTS